METKDKLLKVSKYVKKNELSFDDIDVRPSDLYSIEVKFRDIKGTYDILSIDNSPYNLFHPRIVKLIDEIYSHLPKEVRETDKEKIARLEKENEELKKRPIVQVKTCPCMPKDKIAVVPTMQYCTICNTHYNAMTYHICPLETKQWFESPFFVTC